MNLAKTAALIMAGTLSLTGIGAASAASETGTLHVKLDDVKFSPLRGGPVEIAVLSGDPQTGPSSIYLKFPPNFPGAMHWHTHEYNAIVVKGQAQHWVEGESEADAPLLLPGDFFHQPGGEHTVHQDSFRSDEETIIFLRFDGPVDAFFKE